MAVRYDEKNVAPQCYQCNSMREGQAGAFAIYLMQKYDHDVIHYLELKRKTKFRACKATVKQLTDYYRELANERAKKYGIKF